MFHCWTKARPPLFSFPSLFSVDPGFGLHLVLFKKSLNNFKVFTCVFLYRSIQLFFFYFITRVKFVETDLIMDFFYHVKIVRIGFPIPFIIFLQIDLCSYHLSAETESLSTASIGSVNTAITNVNEDLKSDGFASKHTPDAELPLLPLMILLLITKMYIIIN